MKMLRLPAMVLALGLVAPVAHARTSVPVVDFENVQVVAASGKPATPAQIKAAIETAAQKNGWTLAPTGANQAVATLEVRGKHTVMTDISYQPGQYTLKYKDSVNMNYDPSKKVIHPFYNKWVQILVDGIRAEAARR